MEEIEVKFLDVDVQVLKKKLAALGAKKVFDRLYKRQLFDFPGWPLNAKGAWLRVRDEGDRVTMTFKQRKGVKDLLGGTINDEGMEEIEMEVSDFGKAVEIARALGMVDKITIENKRERWVLKGKSGEVELDFDTIPMVPTYLEIEAKSWKDVDWMIEALGLDHDKKKIMGMGGVYALHGINEADYSLITFEKQIKRA